MSLQGHIIVFLDNRIVISICVTYEFDFCRQIQHPSFSRGMQALSCVSEIVSPRAFLGWKRFNAAGPQFAIQYMSIYSTAVDDII